MKKIIILTLKFVVTVLIISYIINVTDYNLITNIISNCDKLLLSFSFLILFFITFLQAYRFHLVTSNFEIDISLYKSWKNIALGILYNQVLPSTIGGDGIRFLNMKELNYSSKNSFKSIVIDRIYGLISLCLLCGIGSLALMNFNLNSKFLTITQLISFTSILMFFLIPFFLKKYVNVFFKKNNLIEILNDIYFSFKKKIYILKVLFLSLLIHLLVSVVGFLILSALKVNINLWPFMWLFSSSLLLSTIPVSIGGWGFREGIFIISMKSLDIDSETAIIISLIYASQFSLIGLVGGTLWSSRFVKRN